MSNKERQVLGKGIGSLIRKNPNFGSNFKPNLSSSSSAQEGLLSLALSEILVNPKQPRRHFDPVALNELSQSIAESGVLQAILVRPVASGYEIIAGERRYRAAKMAGLTHIPAIIRRSDDQHQLELALVENLQRADLSPIEEAKGYDRLAQEFSLTQDEIARKVGKDRSTVTNLLRLLRLSPAVQELIHHKKLSAGHARALLSLTTPRQQEELAHVVVNEGLSVRACENLVKRWQKTPKANKNSIVVPNPNLSHALEQAQRALGTKVEWHPKAKGGQLRILCFSNDELSRLLTLLTKN